MERYQKRYQSSGRESGRGSTKRYIIAILVAILLCGLAIVSVGKLMPKWMTGLATADVTADVSQREATAISRFIGSPAAPASSDITDYGLYAHYCTHDGPDISQLISRGTPAQAPIGRPTFDGAIETDAYFIPTCEDSQPWYTGAWDEGHDRFATACDVPEARRGFYEDVKCHGIGVCHGKQYGPDIGKVEGSNAHTLDNAHPSGETMCGTTPAPHRTLAVNTQPGTSCFIPYGSLVYLQFPGADAADTAESQWTDWYVAEDTNAALRGTCGAEIFAGDEDGYRSAVSSITGKRPQVWVFPPGGASPLTEQIFTEAIPPDQQPIGVYSIKPSFSTTLDYDLTEYRTVQERIVFGDAGLVHKVNTCEKAGTGLASCVASGVRAINTDLLAPLTAQYGVRYELVDGPCNPEENIKSDFVEGYTACLESPDTACVCEIAMQRAAQSQDAPTIAFTLQPPAEMPPTAMGIDQFLAHLPGKAVRNLQGIPAFTDETVTIRLDEGEREKTVAFYKSPEGLASIADGDRGNKPMCTTGKRTFKFCARRLDKEYLVFDERTGHTALRPIEYRFALTFPDSTPPPPVEGVAIMDAPMATESLLITWEKSPATDLARYDVLLAPSSQDLFAQALSASSLREQSRTVSLPIADAETIQGDLTRCVLDLQTKECRYQLVDGNTLALRQGVLYHVVGRKEYYMVIVNGLEDVPYDAAILAVDAYGNEARTVNPASPLEIARSVQPVDDLPPAPIDGLTILPAGEPETITLEWNNPHQNVDGSPLDDLAGFIIYAGQTLTGNSADTTGLAGMTKLYRLRAEDAGCDDLSIARCRYTMQKPSFPSLAVGAIDQSGNVYLAAAQAADVR